MVLQAHRIVDNRYGGLKLGTRLQASDSGNLLGGEKIIPVRADSTCIDAAAATTAAERLFTAEKVAGIMGADCSGVTIAVANNACSKWHTDGFSFGNFTCSLNYISDNGYFFRTAII